MGRVKKGILDGFSGKVGTVIGGSWRGIEYMRAISHKRQSGFSARQEEQRARFALAMAFTTSMGDLLAISYRNYANQMTGANSAHSYVFKNAITGNYPDLKIDYPKVVVARGKLSTPLGASAASTTADTINFSWVNSMIPQERENDRTILVAYLESQNRTVYTIGASTRISGSGLLHLPGFSGQEVHTWIAFNGSRQKDVSDSVYTGKVTVL